MTAQDVITAVRRRLGDIRKERWPNDETLLLYVSLCQNDICIFTNFNRIDAWIQLEDDKLVYDLPKNLIKVTRLEYNGSFFPVESRDEIDSDRATLPCALMDAVRYGKLEIVLDPNGEDDLRQVLISQYGVTTDQNSDAIDSTDCELEDDYGVVSNIDIPTPGQPPAPLGQIHVYYTATADLIDIADINEELLLPDIWFAAFLHYVCGMALQDDNDANNIQRGEMEAQKYLRLIAELFKQTSKDFTSNIKSKMDVPIRRI